jgi:hypothetical protein
MATETETFDDLTITAYDTDKIYIEMQRPVSITVLRERLAEIRGDDLHGGRCEETGDEEGCVQITQGVAGN